MEMWIFYFFMCENLLIRDAMGVKMKERLIPSFYFSRMATVRVFPPKLNVSTVPGEIRYIQTHTDM